MSYLLLNNNSADASTPAAGKITLYSKTDKRAYIIDETGTVSLLVTANGADTLNNKTVDLAAGSTSAAPLAFASGTNKTSAAAGEMEFDGKVHYSTHATSERGVNTSEQFITTQGGTFTLVSQTGAQKLFNSPTNGAVTLAAGTTYRFECEFDLSAMAASGSFGFALGGTATLTFVKWWSFADKAALATAAAPQSTVNVTAANTAIATATANAVGWAVIGGILRVNAGGTVIPQVSLGTAAAAVVGQDSFFKLYPWGSGTVVSVGNWS